MSTDLKLLGSKLLWYRNQLQLSQNEIAQCTGISVDRLQDFENGLQEPSGDEILIISDYYRCDYRYFISNEKIPASDKIDTLYRKHGNTFSKADRWAIQEFLFLCECEQFCIKEIGKPAKTEFSFKPSGSYFKDHGKHAAESFRIWSGYNSEEITKEDIYADFRSTGAHLFRRKLSNSDISGLFINHPIAGKCVLVNYVEDVYRQRFTVAHEFAHSVLDSDNAEVIVSLKKWSKDDLVEIRANAFASNFLLPSSVMQNQLAINSTSWTTELISKIANKLRVNPMTLLIRLKEERLITDSEFDALRKSKISFAEKIDPELSGDYTQRIISARKSLLERGLSTSYVKLCYETYEKQIISAGRLAEMLLTDENVLPEVLDLFKLKLVHEN